MPKFIFAFHGGTQPKSPEEGKAMMAAWMAWMGDIEASIVDPGAPVGMSKTVSSGGVADDGGSNPLSGFTIVQADDIAGAVALAKGCPIHESGGSVEVAELMNMSMDGK
jgi:hypothetical protein